METRAKQPKEQNTSSSKDLVIHRVFQLPVSTLWKAWTEPGEFRKWWGPKNFTSDISRMEPRVGGRYLSCMISPDGKEIWSTGTVKEFIPGKKLVVTDSFSDENGNIKSAADYGMPGNWPKELLITVELEEADGATKMVLTHEGVPVEIYDECKQGWNESFDKLEKNIQ